MSKKECAECVLFPLRTGPRLYCACKPWPSTVYSKTWRQRSRAPSHFLAGMRWSLFCFQRSHNRGDNRMSDQMTLQYMALTDLLKTDKNPKKHDLPALRASMLRWGFTQPLAIDERSGKLVEGHGRIEVLQEMKKAGGKPPLRVTAKGKEWFAPVVRGLSFANDQEAEAYLIAANQLTTAGVWDDGLLGSMLAQLQQANVSFEGLGFDQSTITSMLS